MSHFILTKGSSLWASLSLLCAAPPNPLQRALLPVCHLYICTGKLPVTPLDCERRSILSFFMFLVLSTYSGPCSSTNIYLNKSFLFLSQFVWKFSLRKNYFVFFIRKYWAVFSCFTLFWKALPNVSFCSCFTSLPVLRNLRGLPLLLLGSLAVFFLVVPCSSTDACLPDVWLAHQPWSLGAVEAHTVNGRVGTSV